MHEVLAWLIMALAMTRMCWMLVRPRRLRLGSQFSVGVSSSKAVSLDAPRSDAANAIAG